jgi:hypothetical protein
MDSQVKKKQTKSLGLESDIKLDTGVSSSWVFIIKIIRINS